MNSLNWLLSPKSRSSFQLQSDHQTTMNSTATISSTSTLTNNSIPSNATSIDNLISGPRESESELVDEMVESVERLNGIEAANNLERKASINSEGEVRVGLTGISERRRTFTLSLDEERTNHLSDSIHPNDHLIPLKTINSISSLDSASSTTSTSTTSSTSDLPKLAHEPTHRSPILSSIASAATRLALTSIPTSSSASSNTSSPLRPSITSDNLPTKPALKLLHSGPLKLLKSKSNSSSSPTRSPKPSSSAPLSTPSTSSTSKSPSSSSSSSNPPSVTITQLDQHHKRSHQLARLLPVRLGVSLYILIRKFLAIFGLRLPPAPSEHSTPLLIVEPPKSNQHPRSIAKLLWKSNPTSQSSLTVPMIVSEDEVTGSLVMTDASSSADESDSTLTSNLLSVPSTPSNSLHPPTRSRNGKPSKRINKVPIQPTSELKTTVLGSTRNKTLVLDLDETLIHSTSRLGGMGGAGTLGGGGSGSAVHAGLKVRVVEVVLDGRIVVYHVYKRPWVDFFLKTVSSWYTVVIFTASMREYADPVIDWLDQGRGIIDGRLFRESCTNIKGSYMKDLTIVERDLSKVCLVDNSPISYGLHQANGIPIEGWLNDPTDEGLLDLLPMLDSLRFTKDVRRILGLRGFSQLSNPMTNHKNNSNNTIIKQTS